MVSSKQITNYSYFVFVYFKFYVDKCLDAITALLVYLHASLQTNQQLSNEQYHHPYYNLGRGFEYSRTGNPTRGAFERAIAIIEHAEYGIAFSSGLVCMAHANILQ